VGWGPRLGWSWNSSKGGPETAQTVPSGLASAPSWNQGGEYNFSDVWHGHAPCTVVPAPLKFKATDKTLGFHQKGFSSCLCLPDEMAPRDRSWVWFLNGQCRLNPPKSILGVGVYRRQRQAALAEMR
jgi:hypothetical protein